MARKCAAILGIMSLVLCMRVSFSWAQEGASIKDPDGNVVLGPVTKNDLGRAVELLGDGSGFIRDRARAVLAGFGKDALPFLHKALEEGQNVGEVLMVLAEIRDESSVGPISRYINAPAWETANNARGALRVYGPAAASVLIGLLKEDAYRDAAIDVLKDIPPSSEALEAVRPLTGGESPSAKRGAARVLGIWHDTASAGDITRLLKDGDAAVRLDAVKAYNDMYSDEPGKYDLDAVLPLLQDPSTDVRIEAARILGAAPSERTVLPLLEVVEKDKDPKARAAAVVALEKTNDQRAVFPLIKALGDEDRDVVSNAIYELGVLKAKEAVPYIVGLFKGKLVKDENIQWTTFITLPKIGEPVEMSIFVPYLKMDLDKHSEDELLKFFAAMSKPGDTEVIAALEEYKTRKDNPATTERVDAILERIR